MVVGFGVGEINRDVGEAVCETSALGSRNPAIGLKLTLSARSFFACTSFTFATLFLGTTATFLGFTSASLCFLALALAIVGRR